MLKVTANKMSGDKPSKDFKCEEKHEMQQQQPWNIRSFRSSSKWLHCGYNFFSLKLHQYVTLQKFYNLSLIREWKQVSPHVFDGTDWCNVCDWLFSGLFRKTCFLGDLQWIHSPTVTDATPSVASDQFELQHHRSLASLSVWYFLLSRITGSVF